MNGEGYLQYDSGVFKGNYLKDLKHGPGTCIFSSGKQIEGNWVNGKQEGRGKFTNEKGVTKIGIWENGQRISWV
jgi:hypothetical protein